MVAVILYVAGRAGAGDVYTEEMPGIAAGNRGARAQHAAATTTGCTWG